MDNAISFTWKRRDEGARAEGDPKQCYLSSWIVHCDGEGKKMRCKWEKNILWETWWRWLWVRCQRWGWQILVTVCLKKSMHMHKCAFNTKQYVFLWRRVWCHILWAVRLWFSDMFCRKRSSQSFQGGEGNHHGPPLHPTSTSVELITLSFTYVKVVVLHFQKFFSWSFILGVYCLMSAVHGCFLI